MDDLERELWMRLLDIPGIEEGANSWGDDTALWVNAKQMANLQRSGGIEIRLGRPLIRELKPKLTEDPRVTLRSSSDWVGFSFAAAGDFDFIVEMASLAAGQYLPSDSTAPRPPPSGAAMERRKRFH